MLVYTWAVFIYHDESFTVLEVLITFIMCNIFLGVFFHSTAKNPGWWFTDALGKEWVKGIYYIYLPLSFLGVLRILAGLMTEVNLDEEISLHMRSTLDFMELGGGPSFASGDTHNHTNLRDLTLISILMIGLGVALRITEKSIEVFEWDQRPPFKK
jgi:hypothetical protein